MTLKLNQESHKINYEMLGITNSCENLNHAELQSLI
jgi:hypothetical protein